MTILRRSPVGSIGAGLAILAVLSLNLGAMMPVRSSEMIEQIAAGTVALISTFTAVILCIVSLVREKQKWPAILGIAILVLGESYLLPMVLLDVTVMAWPLLLILAAVLIWRRYKRRQV
jgi:hypothetical protein